MSGLFLFCMCASHDFGCVSVFIVSMLVVVTLGAAVSWHYLRSFPFFRNKPGLAILSLITFLLLLGSLYEQAIGEFLKTLSTCIAILAAFWKDEIVDFMNPLSVELSLPEPDADAQLVHLKRSGGANEACNSIQFHAAVINNNSSRPLLNAGVFLIGYAEGDGPMQKISVARQFTWAPHESEPPRATITYPKKIDFCYLRKANGNVALIIYESTKEGLVYRGGEPRFNNLSLPLKLSLTVYADKLEVPYLLRVERPEGEPETLVFTFLETN